MKAYRPWILAGSLLVGIALLSLNLGLGEHSELLLALRLPRVVLAVAVGMGLAVCGAILQALFSNPLCEPYTLGVSSGAALGAVLGGAVGLGLDYSGLAGAALFGALAFAGALYLFSRLPGVNQFSLLLAGVMLGFLGSSLVALWMALSDSSGISGAMFWLLGDLSRARLKGALVALGSILLLVALAWSRSSELDALLMGEEGAASLGLDVAATRKKLVLLSSCLAGLCVSSAGMIGFVGLLVPHLARRWVGALHRKLIPLCALLGALVLVLADALSRWILSSIEIPVGVVCSLVGAPVFVWILLRWNRRRVAS